MNIYVDEGICGSKYHERKAMLQMVEESDSFDYIAVYSVGGINGSG
ncbi:hypothetical protein [Halobacillus litoralis]